MGSYKSFKQKTVQNFCPSAMVVRGDSDAPNSNASIAILKMSN